MGLPLFIKRPPADELDRVQFVDGGAPRERGVPKFAPSAATRAAQWENEGGKMDEAITMA